MYRADPARVRGEAGPICVVGLDASRLNTLHGTNLHHVDVAVAVRAEPVLAEVHPCAAADRSESLRRVLENLHARHRFTSIHFPKAGGLAFRSIQARRAGLTFQGTEIVVHPGAGSRAEREARQSWPAGPDDLIVDYMEAYCEQPQNTTTPGAELPLVTVGIAHFNLGLYLPAAVKSLLEQTYPHLEILIVDDGSTDRESLAVVEGIEAASSRIRVLRQANAGIGAARNRLLAEARGAYFVPMDADNLARPNMIEAFVRAMNRNPHLSAMTCYFEAFSDDPRTPLYGYRPTGGPHVLSCIRNVYGDANGVFRTEDFRSVGGYETDRGTSCEDWEAYVKLVRGGKQIDVVPEVLFDYRHREAGFSRATNWFANHQRVMRQFPEDHWSALLGFQQENQRLREQLNSRRHRLADAIHRSLTSPFRWWKR